MGRHRLPTLGITSFDRLIASFHEEHRKKGFSDQESDLAECDKDEQTWGGWRRTQSGELSPLIKVPERFGLPKMVPSFAALPCVRI